LVGETDLRAGIGAEDTPDVGENWSLTHANRCRNVYSAPGRGAPQLNAVIEAEGNRIGGVRSGSGGKGPRLPCRRWLMSTTTDVAFITSASERVTRTLNCGARHSMFSPRSTRIRTDQQTLGYGSDELLLGMHDAQDQEFVCNTWLYRFPSPKPTWTS
jgi:hypothetical protein